MGPGKPPGAVPSLNANGGGKVIVAGGVASATIHNNPSHLWGLNPIPAGSGKTIFSQVELSVRGAATYGAAPRFLLHSGEDSPGGPADSAQGE